MNLEHNRHTLAHLLAQAVLERYPDAKLTLGPAVDNGFYYDIDFGETKLSDADLPALEALMKEHLPAWTAFTHEEVSPEEARERFAGNPYKLELIDEIAARGEPITLYAAGGFTDLCRGGHAEHPAHEIPADSFALDRVAGAYWRGDERNTMLTRIYGLAFGDGAALAAFRAAREEARARDHRKIGQELDLFTFSELVGPGLPLWTPRGTLLRSQLDAFVWELRSRHGYQRVTIPHITKRALYETSGHWQKFADELFHVATREGKEYALKPMNCPHHTQIFARKPHSYREMPQRYAETTMVYRDEQSGELGGLTRVLSITQDDSHVFCRHSQVKEEFFAIWDIIDTFYKTFGFSLRVRLSFHDPAEMEKYLGTPEIWENAENALREIAKERHADYFEAPGEAAMYGPKLDFMATDSMGRQHQVATIQLDMNLPERFDLSCTNEEGQKERIVMIHCAVMGSIERFSAVLLEHTAGALPSWLAPTQAIILPIADAHAEYAHQVADGLLEAGIRAMIDASSESLGKRIRTAKTGKVPYVLVVGSQEAEHGTVSVESREKGKLDGMSQEQFREMLLTEIRERA
ncbi:MAG TPA: threonine--tRNA ligase [Candidatus Paceibacterota bacterium]|nr:threonine--tRNA ligase [Candidatus Paceibacterota bacterium]